MLAVILFLAALWVAAFVLGLQLDALRRRVNKLDGGR